MSNKSKLGNMSTLGQFSGLKSSPSPNVAEDKTTAIELPTDKKEAISLSDEKMVAINIKISKSQKDWLGAQASLVRENNPDPVPPSERVYPQHLVRVAIQLLQEADVDWTQVKNIDELLEQLNR